MAKRADDASATPLTPTDDVEWAGTVERVPWSVGDGQGGAYGVQVAMWTETPSGAVVGFEIVPADETEGALAKLLTRCMVAPAVGEARRPARVRVPHEDLAAEIRESPHELPVTIAAVPECDEAIESLVRYTAKEKDSQPSYFESGRVSPEAVARLFEATRYLATVAPWKQLADSQVVRVDIPELGVLGACVSVIGALGESLGVMIFPDLRSFQRFMEAAIRAQEGGKRMSVDSSWLALNVERGAELSPRMRREAMTHGWKVKDSNSYPMLQRYGPGFIVQPMAEGDADVAAAIAFTLPTFVLRCADALERDAAEPASMTIEQDGGPSVRLTCPYETYALFDAGSEPAPPAPAPTSTARDAVGRNDLCPCGSGRKYKKCHMNRDQAESNRVKPLFS